MIPISNKRLRIAPSPFTFTTLPLSPTLKSLNSFFTPTSPFLHFLTVVKFLCEQKTVVPPYCLCIISLVYALVKQKFTLVKKFSKKMKNFRLCDEPLSRCCWRNLRLFSWGCVPPYGGNCVVRKGFAPAPHKGIIPLTFYFLRNCFIAATVSSETRCSIWQASSSALAGETPIFCRKSRIIQCFS